MNCYARILGDCQGGLSREHYISKSVLALFGEFQIVSGTAWMRSGDGKRLSINAQTVKVLCGKHNSDLSSLDTTARDFVTALRDAFLVEGSSSSVAGPSDVTIDGGLLERWLLKVMTGALAGGIARRGDERFDWQPSVPWLNLLFGRERFERERGLYVRPAAFNPRDNNAVGLQPLWHGDHCTGGVIHLFGIQFAIFTERDAEPWLRERSTGETRELLRRPRELVFDRASGDRRIGFTWDGPHSATGIRFNQSPGPKR